MEKILIIQTAFIGDAILASALVEAVHLRSPSAQIDILIRKGNESLYSEHPFIHQVLVWDKKRKWISWWQLLQQVKEEKYDELYVAQRFATMGLFALLSEAKVKVGYENNPFAFGFTKKIAHRWGQGVHEVYRLLDLIGEKNLILPKLYPSTKDWDVASQWNTSPYITLSPSSVWATKRAPDEIWYGIAGRSKGIKIYLLGGPSDLHQLEFMAKKMGEDTEVLAGKLTLLQSAALMQGASMNYVNDSGPLHLATAMNAPTTAIFCSTVPEFGFGPLSENSRIWQTHEKLSCRPCGMHGHNRCPKGHFACGQIAIPDRL
jgi:ADP-heptose:LPS heptosyltransferase